MKGKLLKQGIGIASMLDVCYANKWTNDNTICEYEIGEFYDTWAIYEKINN